MFTIKEICDHLNGVCNGDGSIVIQSVNSIEKAQKGEICFLTEIKYEKYAYQSDASAILLQEDLILKEDINPLVLRVKDVSLAYKKLLSLFAKDDEFEQGNNALFVIGKDCEVDKGVLIGNFTHIANGAKIEEGTRIATQVYIGERVKIGKNVKIYPGVKVLKDCVVGDNCILHPNVVIGSDGFGFDLREDGSFESIPQIGNVIIEEDVEVGANTCIDRSTFGSTVIKKGVKLDNLIQIAHNVEIGQNTAMAAQSGVAGSVTIGKNCIIGGQSAFVPHITVADGSQFQGKSGVGRSIKKKGGKYYGYPAIDFISYIKSYAVFKILPQLEKKIKLMEKDLEKLKDD